MTPAAGRIEQHPLGPVDQQSAECPPEPFRFEIIVRSVDLGRSDGT
jgi:hypothetical protein